MDKSARESTTLSGERVPVSRPPRGDRRIRRSGDALVAMMKAAGLRDRYNVVRTLAFGLFEREDSHCRAIDEDAPCCSKQGTLGAGGGDAAR